MLKENASVTNAIAEAIDCLVKGANTPTARRESILVAQTKLERLVPTSPALLSMARALAQFDAGQRLMAVNHLRDAAKEFREWEEKQQTGTVQ